MTRTGQDAIDYGRGRVGNGPPPPAGMEASGYCLKFVRECYAVPSYYASAVDAWNASATQHPGDRNPPPGVPLFWRTPSQYDHVALGGANPGEVLTTYNDDVRRYTAESWDTVIDMMDRDFDGTYLGWTEDVNTVTVWAPPVPEPPPPPIEVPEDDTMELVRIIEDGRIMALGTYQWTQVPTIDDYNAQAQVWGAYTEVGIGDAQRLNDQVNRNITDLAHSLTANGVGAGTSAATFGTRQLATLALLVAVAVLVGLVVFLRGDTTATAAYAGGGTLLGGLLVLVLAHVVRADRGPTR
jgi:hypothetical protein